MEFDFVDQMARTQEKLTRPRKPAWLEFDRMATGDARVRLRNMTFLRGSNLQNLWQILAKPFTPSISFFSFLFLAFSSGIFVISVNWVSLSIVPIRL